MNMVVTALLSLVKLLTVVSNVALNTLLNSLVTAVTATGQAPEIATVGTRLQWPGSKDRWGHRESKVGLIDSVNGPFNV
jgi:hypothetical protein